MRIEGERRSDNVEDRRAMGGGRIAVGGGIGTLLLVAVYALMGGDLSKIGPMLGGGGDAGGSASAPYQPTAEEEKRADFVRVVLAETEDVWTAQFRQMGKAYVVPKLVLFRGQVQSACGAASAAMGPFYCPGDQKVYIDLGFYDELDKKFHAKGDFAQAYVIAHEVGHHVQNLLGTSEMVNRKRQSGGKVEANALSVRLELQADFLAGVWAHHTQKTKHLLEEGDIEEALTAATAIGDDTLQREATGRVVPDAFTHGTSAQRVAWFKLGFQTGDVRQGNTFDDATYARVGGGAR